MVALVIPWVAAEPYVALHADGGASIALFAHIPADHSPPGLLTAQSAILRI